MDTSMFESEEEMAALVAQATLDLLSASAEQRSVGWGDHFLRWAIEEDGVVPVFGQVADLDALLEREWAAGATPDELVEDRLLLASLYDLGFRPARCYSRRCPAGEDTTVHVVDIDWKLPPRSFELARAHGWNVGNLLTAGLLALVAPESPRRPPHPGRTPPP